MFVCGRECKEVCVHVSDTDNELLVMQWLSYWPRQEVLRMLKNRLYLVTPASALDIITPGQTQLITESSGLFDAGRKATG